MNRDLILCFDLAYFGCFKLPGLVNVRTDMRQGRLSKDWDMTGLSLSLQHKP